MENDEEERRHDEVIRSDGPAAPEYDYSGHGLSRSLALGRLFSHPEPALDGHNYAWSLTGALRGLFGDPETVLAPNSHNHSWSPVRALGCILCDPEMDSNNRHWTEAYWPRSFRHCEFH